MQMQNQATNPNRPPLNPFALPPSTTFRFILLLIAVLGASLYIFGYLYITIPTKFQLTDTAVNNYEIVRQTHSANTDADSQMIIAAAYRYLVPADQNEAFWTLGCTLLETGLALLIFLLFPTLLQCQRRLRSLDENPAYLALSQHLAHLCQGLMLPAQPTFLMDTRNYSTIDGETFGYFGKYYVVLSLGLINEFRIHPDVFDAYVLHELAHVRNKDINKTYFTISLCLAFIITALLPLLPILIPLYYNEITAFFLAALLSKLPLYFNAPHGTLIQSFQIIGLLLVVVFSGSSVLRAREIYADIRAASWHNNTQQFIATLFGPRTQQPQSHLAHWLMPFRFHPAVQSRQELLNDPQKVSALRFGDIFGAGIATTIAFPNIVEFVYLFHLFGYVGAIGAVAITTAALIVSLLLVSILTSALWYQKLFNGSRTMNLRLAIRLSFGLGLGLLLGFLLSLQ